MADFLWNTLTSAAATTALLLFLGWLFREWIAARLSKSIQHEYDKKIEEHKAALKKATDAAVETLKDSQTKLRELVKSASSTFGTIHAVAHERRLKAIEVAWGAIVEVKTETPAGVYFVDTFREDEYDKFLARPDLQPFLDDISAAGLNKTKFIRSGPEVEKWRPFMGEYIYSLYEAYRTLTLRVVVIIALGKANNKVEPWFRDEGNQNLIGRVLTTEELAEFEASEAKFAFIRNAIEQKVLRKSARIISGEASAAQMLEQGTQILDAVHNLTNTMKREGVPAT